MTKACMRDSRSAPGVVMAARRQGVQARRRFVAPAPVRGLRGHMGSDRRVVMTMMRHEPMARRRVDVSPPPAHAAHVTLHDLPMVMGSRGCGSMTAVMVGRHGRRGGRVMAMMVVTDRRLRRRRHDQTEQEGRGQRRHSHY